MTNQCLHQEGSWGKCSGDIVIVENFTTGRRFEMCEKHAERYYQEQDRIHREYLNDTVSEE